MASKRQGLLLGCVFIIAAGVLLFAIGTFLLSAPWGKDIGGLHAGGRVGLILLEGPISTSRTLVNEIDANRQDGSIRAVVLRINSPGGDVAPSQEIYEAVLRLAEEKPVVASFGSVAASGAYYAAAAADSIVADPGSVVGSIGVIFMYPTGAELLDKVGVSFQVYKSGRLKDMGSFSRKPTEEEEAVFDSIIADVYDQFVTAVAGGRGMDREQVYALADGRIFSGRQAKEVGLVDQLGDLYTAINLAADLGGLPPEPRIARKARPRIPLLDLLDQIFADSAQSGFGPRLEYRLR